MDGTALAGFIICVQIWDMNAISDFQYSLIDNASVCVGIPAREALAVLFLDHRGDVAHLYEWTDGDISLVRMNARHIVHEALKRQHERFILVHNHPSGDPTPSLADIRATKRLSRIASALDLELVDHIIVGAGKCFSFRAAGLL